MLDEPGPDNPDFPSVARVARPPELYTDDELASLVAFAARQTAEHDRLYAYRRGANLILLQKVVTPDDTYWLRSRLCWLQPPQWQHTLDEAIARLERPIGT